MTQESLSAISRESRQLLDKLQRLGVTDRLPAPESSIRVPRQVLEEIAERIPNSPPTGNQKTALREISRDMASLLPMRRVLNGDVDCGKNPLAPMALP